MSGRIEYDWCLSFQSFLFFFFKQKTAYEMRISDWSSDVCSSDLDRVAFVDGDGAEVRHFEGGADFVLDRAFLDALGEVSGEPAFVRSEVRRVGKECVSTCRSRWSQYN